MATLTVVRNLEEYLKQKNIEYTVLYTYQSNAVIATVQNFLVFLTFRPTQRECEQALFGSFPGANFKLVDKLPVKLSIESYETVDKIHILAEGTEFQENVWTALLKIPRGKTCTYSDIAEEIGKPKAVRAVGSAAGKNPVSVFIPCHRVVCKGAGNPLKYGGGAEMKRKILEKEGVMLC